MVRAVEEMPGQVLDLIFTVEDLGGQVQELRLQETPAEVRIELAADVLFEFDQYAIAPKAEGVLKQVATVIQDRAKGPVRIEGHTDAKGSDAYNKTLSERRADSVRVWLVEKEGLRSVPFTTAGFGAKRPIAPNAKPDGSDDPEGRQRNRRVDIIIVKR